MRAYVPSLALVLGAVSLAEAAVFDRRQQVPTSSVNLADGFISMFNRLGAAQTVTETLRQIITVGAGGDVGAGINATAAVTVTVTAAASTVTVCPGQANGAVDWVSSDGSASATPGGAAGSAAPPALVIPSGGIGVIVVSVPEAARKTSLVGNQPATSQSTGPQLTASETVVSQSTASQTSASETAASGSTASGTIASDSVVSQSADASSSLAPLPTQGEANLPELVTPPGFSATLSVTSLAPLPGAANPSSDPIAGAPVSDSSTAIPTSSSTTSLNTSSATTLATASAAISDTTIGPLPGLASSLSDTLSISTTGNGPAAIPTSNPAGAFGGSAGLIPIASAADPPATPTTPGVANGAGIFPTINVSGLTLSSQLNLGNLAQRTSTARL